MPEDFNRAPRDANTAGFPLKTCGNDNYNVQTIMRPLISTNELEEVILIGE